MSRRIFILIAVIAIAIAGGYFAIQSISKKENAEMSSTPTEYFTLDTSLDLFISDFNSAKGSVRLVFVVGPSCGTCLRGLDDMNRAVGDMTRGNPALKTFVLYVPMLGAGEHHAARAVRLMAGTDIRHYWDPDGQSGVELQKALGINKYAWDVWLAYDRNAVWEGGAAPVPAYWEHQLDGMAREIHLDPARFAARVAALLEGVDDTG